MKLQFSFSIPLSTLFRKEARRRELKKNKKQRQVVRVATLKGKNPREIIEELEKIDDMEYNPITPCALNAKVNSNPNLYDLSIFVTR